MPYPSVRSPWHCCHHCRRHWECWNQVASCSGEDCQSTWLPVWFLHPWHSHVYVFSSQVYSWKTYNEGSWSCFSRYVQLLHHEFDVVDPVLYLYNIHIKVTESHNIGKWPFFSFLFLQYSNWMLNGLLSSFKYNLTNLQYGFWRKFFLRLLVFLLITISVVWWVQTWFLVNWT